ncbi:MAG: FtsQ-type POTRA domain-containing protein [Oscillospiraceae bacterium]|jgi:hypothetical protein|nr:FtsQ-type POTRA domain-containing protein [Oscillospiraceae bacterium]
MPEFNESRRRKPPPSRSARPAGQNAVKTQKKPKSPPKPKARKTAEPKSKQRRRQNMAIYYLMFLLVAVLVFSILSVTVLFTLEVIETEGDSIYSDEQIIEVSGIRTGVNLLRFDTSESRKRIMDSLVYIDNVEIHKNLPNKITIHVVEAVEMASIEHEGLYYKISKNGRILGTIGRNSQFTAIYGFEADEPVVGGYISSAELRKTGLIFTLMETAAEVGLTGIIDINIEDFLDIRMNYMNRIVLHVGPSIQLEDKLRAAVHILTEDIEQNERGTLRLIEQQPVFTPE